MPKNKNPWIEKLLSWHGHDQGGVSVPFNDRGGNPLRDEHGDPKVIETNLIKRLRDLARDIAEGTEAPRWIFLVGGPGNGKSEAVQEFLYALDRELQCDGKLVGILKQKFSPAPLVPWNVEVNSDDSGLPDLFKEKIQRLIVVQDASASNNPRSDAANEIVNKIADLATHPPSLLLPVFICCINRGLLARALTVAHKDWGSGNEVVRIIEALIEATAMRQETLSENKDRPPCWPLNLDISEVEKQVCCWPLDVESLLLPENHGGSSISPVEQIIEKAIVENEWEVSGRCADCESADLCPFRQNAIWLRNEETRDNLLSILRRGELAISQRWNFRDTFSLIAGTLVGNWNDFAEFDHPCEWAHEKVVSICQQVQTRPEKAVAPAIALVSRLYPNAMFPVPMFLNLQEKNLTEKITLEVKNSITLLEKQPQTHIQNLLRHSISPRLDPAFLSPLKEDHPIRKLENSYSQSVEIGNQNWDSCSGMSKVESIFFTLLKSAEEEWDPLSRESAQILEVLRFLGVVGVSLAKRSVGTRLGYHTNEDYLLDYEAVIRDEDALYDLTQELRSLLGAGGFHFNALESFGQPRSEDDWLIALRGDTMPIAPITPAPIGGRDLPAHDFPFIKIVNYSIPLTFDLYMALRLRQDGCESSSLPASVRAAIDRIRHLHAGQLCRDQEAFVNGKVFYEIKDYGKIDLPREGESPRLREMR